MPEEIPNHKAKLTQGPVGPLLFKMTVPMIWGLLAIMSFNLVDTIFIGRLGTVPLAAISFTFPVVMVLTNLAIGLGIGTSSVVARAIGEHDHHKVQNLAISSLFLSLLIVGIFATVGIFTIDPLFSMLGAGPAMLPLIRQYMEVWYAGLIFLVVPMVGNYIIRATGDMFWPGVIMVFSSLVNLILDPILIFGLFGFPRLEMRGAAIATIVAWMFTFAASSSILFFREKIISFHIPEFFLIRSAWKSILHVAIPAASNHMINPIGMGIVMSMVAGYGKEAVAAFGSASRVEMFAFIIFLAMSSIIGPFVGQNIGTHQYPRIKEALRQLYKFCIIFGLLQAIVLTFFSRPIMGLFDKNLLVINYGISYLALIPISYMAHGALFVSSGVFNGSGHPLPAVFISLIRMFVLYIPLAYIFKSIFGLYGIFGAYSLASLIMGTVAGYLSYRLILKFEASR